MRFPKENTNLLQIKQVLISNASSALNLSLFQKNHWS